MEQDPLESDEINITKYDGNLGLEPRDSIPGYFLSFPDTAGFQAWNLGNNPSKIIPGMPNQVFQKPG